MPPRNPASIITFDPATHQATLDKAIQWEDCPTDEKPVIRELIMKYWDVFAPEGLKNHIRGFTCHIDTGMATPVCCKVPRYGPHEARVIAELTRGLAKSKRTHRRGTKPVGSASSTRSKTEPGTRPLERIHMETNGILPKT